MDEFATDGRADNLALRRVLVEVRRDKVASVGKLRLSHQSSSHESGVLETVGGIGRRT